MRTIAAPELVVPALGHLFVIHLRPVRAFKIDQEWSAKVRFSRKPLKCGHQPKRSLGEGPLISKFVAFIHLTKLDDGMLFGCGRVFDWNVGDLE